MHSARKLYAELEKFGSISPLGKLCEIERNNPTQSPDYRQVEKLEGGESEEPSLLSGDIILHKRMTWAPLIGCSNAYVYSGEDMALSKFQRESFRLRPKTNDIPPGYISQFLNSDRGCKLLGILATDPEEPENFIYSCLPYIPIPVVEHHYISGWDNHIDQTIERQRKLDQEATEIRSSLFDVPDGQVFRDQIQELMRRSRLIAASLEAIDHPDFQITNFYPFPLAFRYRMLDSKTDPRELYLEQLRFAENILAFLGSISLALHVHQNDRDRIAIDRFFQKGISAGDWREILNRTCKSFRASEHPLLRSLYRLEIGLQQKGLGKHIDELIQARNDLHHNRGPVTEDDFEQGSEILKNHLQAVIERLAFFTDFPIHLVEAIEPQRNGEIILRCKRLIGDHPALLQENCPYPKALPRGDLYLEMGSQEWIPLFPFMVSLNCPHCRNRETYFIDQWDVGKNIAYLQSFERNHTESSKAVAEGLKGL